VEGDAYWKYFQVEEKSYSTPFVDGSRGTTVETGGGWKDLTLLGNNGEMINNPVYNSDLRSLTFSSDVSNYVLIPNFGKLNGETAATVSIVLKRDLISPQHVIWADGLVLIEMSVGGNLYTRVRWQSDGLWGGMGVLYGTDNFDWQNITITYDNGIVNMYKNGIFNYTYTDDVSTLSKKNVDLYVGYRGGYGSLTGDISQVKFYNKALTSGEVLKNYNAIKRRYNL
jgi:hypothetical protein